MIVVGFKEQAPAVTVQLNVTVPLKLPIAVTVTLKPSTVNLFAEIGVTVNEKSGTVTELYVKGLPTPEQTSQPTPHLRLP